MKVQAFVVKNEIMSPIQSQPLFSEPFYTQIIHIVRRIQSKLKLLTLHFYYILRKKKAKRVEWDFTMTCVNRLFQKKKMCFTTLSRMIITTSTINLIDFCCLHI